MRAVGLMVHGGPEVLEVVELPEVHAGPGQVRVRVYAAAVNPTDTMARNGSRAEQQKADPHLAWRGDRRDIESSDHNVPYHVDDREDSR